MTTYPSSVDAIDSRAWEVGDVVQLNPETVDRTFAGCFMLITEPKQFGAVGFVQVPGSGRAFYRASHQDMHFVGKAEWQPEDDEEDS